MAELSSTGQDSSTPAPVPWTPLDSLRKNRRQLLLRLAKMEELITKMEANPDLVTFVEEFQRNW